MQWTHPTLMPYLKGIHLTLDYWHPGRDTTEGWKNRHFLDEDRFWDKVEGIWVPWEDAPQTSPIWVKPVPCLGADLQAIASFLSSESSSLHSIWKKTIHVAIYGFVDASGQGFGSSFKHKAGILYSYGIWGRESAGDSSNYRELNNLVSSLENHISNGSLVGPEVFIFTDNSTVESTFYKGNTPNKLLFTLVLCLQHLEMSVALLLNVIHVAGSQMIQQGTDGLSLLTWVRGWTGHPHLEPLKMEEWFDRGHGHRGGTRTTRWQWMPSESGDTWLLWMPPPATADGSVRNRCGFGIQLWHTFQIWCQASWKAPCWA